MECTQKNMETTTIRNEIEKELAAKSLGPLPPAILDELATNAEKKMRNIIASVATREAIIKAFREGTPQKPKNKKSTPPAGETKK